MKRIPTIELSTGIIVANFSSPHEFTFDDGSILTACDEERIRALSLDQKEIERPWDNWIDIRLEICLSQEVIEELSELHKFSNPIDIILVPFMVLEAVRRYGYSGYFNKIRVVRMVDRVNKIVSSRKFCV